MKKSALIAGGVIAAALVVGTGVGAQAHSLIQGKDIADSTITGTNVKSNSIAGNDITNGSLHYSDLAPSAIAALKGAPMAGAYYSVANYNAGDTNANAIATVACKLPTDVAISGGVQTLGLGGHSAPVSSSFPGRMDWTTNTPKADRTDGWIVQFDGTVDPSKTKVWALCVPGAKVPVVQTYSQN
jgi:hypothetical protein